MISQNISTCKEGNYINGNIEKLICNLENRLETEIMISDITTQDLSEIGLYIKKACIRR